MSAIHPRVAGKVSISLCAALLATTLNVATAPPARSKALLFVLFTMNSQAYVMRSDGSQMHPVGSQAQAADRDHHLALYNAEAGINEVLWRLNTPDGRRIVWQNPFTTGTSTGRTITDGPGDDSFPAIRAGTVAFVSDRDGDNEIYTVQTDGTGLLQLTDNSADDSEPSWGPDGSLVFTSDRDGNPDIWRMDGDGTDQLKLAFNSSAADTQPEWSPDGSALVITSDRAGNEDVWMLFADLSDPVQLTKDPSDERDPTWSPDGTQIFFSSDTSGDFDIYSMTTTGELVATLTDNTVDDHVTDVTEASPLHMRLISMSISDGGVVRGRVTDQFSLPGCFRRAKVFLHRKKVDGWQPVAETRTNRDGHYRIETGAGAGSLTYRVKIFRSKPAVPLRDIVCSGADAMN